MTKIYYRLSSATQQFSLPHSVAIKISLGSKKNCNTEYERHVSAQRFLIALSFTQIYLIKLQLDFDN